jgi:hypothetical protein
VPAACRIAPPALAKETGRLRCREIVDGDRDAVASLLARGFQCRREFWETALTRLARHDVPACLPRYGYLLDCAGVPVGALLLVFAETEEGGRTILRCNVSSWYVERDYRAFAGMLVSSALRHRQATYVNLTPAPQTIPILKAQGYREFSAGRFLAFPALARPVSGARVEILDAESADRGDLSGFEARLLRTHAMFGCLSVVCMIDGRTFPFVFSLHRSRSLVRWALLAYCSSLDDFMLCAGALGRHLARRSIFCVMIHADAALPGIPGVYLRVRPTFYRGPSPPRPGNLAWSECAMFGVHP